MRNDVSIKTGKNGLGILDVILIVNIILKLIKVINWTWSVVLWPLWVQLELIGIIFIILIIRLKRW